jgi:hypothetical protein
VGLFLKELGRMKRSKDREVEIMAGVDYEYLPHWAENSDEEGICTMLEGLVLSGATGNAQEAGWLNEYQNLMCETSPKSEIF